MIKKIIVGSAQINNGFSGQYYLPYSIGILQAYVLHNSKDQNFMNFLLLSIKDFYWMTVFKN